MNYTFITNQKIISNLIADALSEVFEYYVPVVICVGTDSAIGDSLGPIVGTKLLEANAPCYVYGNLSKTVTAKEILSAESFIKKVHPVAKTLVIDAAIGREEDVGKIKISDTGIYPGLGANKKFPKLGDGAIIGIVSPRSKNNEIFLNLTKLSSVYKMADVIAQGIIRYINRCEQKPFYKPFNGTFSRL